MVMAPKLMLPLDECGQEPSLRLPCRAGYLADDEEVLTLHHLLLELLLDGQPHLVLVLVHVGTVNVTVSKVNRYLHSLRHFAWRGLKETGNGRHGDKTKNETKHTVCTQPRSKGSRNPRLLRDSCFF